MANERMVITNFVGGYIEDSPLLVGATTLTSVDLANLPAIGATQYAEITLDPNGSAGAPEIVHVIQHVVGATPGVVAQIVRGRNGTVARQHAANIPWVMAPTGALLGHKADRVWGGNLVVAGGPYDQEFEREGSPTSLPTGWSWVNQGTATYTEEFGAGVIRLPSPSGSSESHRIITRPIPTLAAFDVYAKLTAHGSTANYFLYGLVVRESGTGKFVTLYNYQSDLLAFEKWNSPTSYNGGYASVTPRPLSPQYFRIRKNSATSWDFLVSQDGIGWFYALGPYDISAFLTGTINEVGFGVSGSQNRTGLYVACHWFRVR